jgi:hypothetical protein
VLSGQFAERRDAKRKASAATGASKRLLFNQMIVVTSE